MDHPRRLAWTDGDHLRQVKLKTRRVRQEFAGRTQDQGMHHEFAAFGRARHEAAGALGAMAGKVVGPERRLVHPRLEFGRDRVHLGRRQDVIDDGRAVFLERGGDLFCIDGAGEVTKRHDGLFRKYPGTAWGRALPLRKRPDYHGPPKMRCRHGRTPGFARRSSSLRAPAEVDAVAAELKPWMDKTQFGPDDFSGHRT